MAGIAPLPVVMSPQVSGSSMPDPVELTSRAKTLNVQRSEEYGAVQNSLRRKPRQCAWNRGISAWV